MMALTEKNLRIERSSSDSCRPRTALGATGEFDRKGEAILETDHGLDGLSLTEQLKVLRREQAKLQQAIFDAAQVQRRLCTPHELCWGGFESAGEIFPVRHLSGDFFKVMELDSTLGFAVGDIAGKGLSAGIWQAHLMALIQRSARRNADPADTVAEVNHELCHDENEPPIMALFFARIGRKGDLVYCNAGLPAPLLLSRGQTVERLEEGGPMLGAVKNAVFHTGRRTLHPGDMLVAYSDGVTECRNSGDEEFEVERLVLAARAVQGLGANQALFSLLGTVLDFAGSCAPNDDLALLVIRRLELVGGLSVLRKGEDSAFPQGVAPMKLPDLPAGGA